MMKPPDPHYRHRFPAELISHAVWLYHVFSLSFRDVELILAERGVVVSYESIRQWCLKFGASFADKLRRRRPLPGDKWYLDEVFIRIQGELHYLWRAVDQDGIVLDILVQHRRDAGAAKRFFKRLEGVCAAGPRHRQARQLRRGEARVDARRRTPQEPLPEQSSGELASTDAAPRTADAALQVSTTSPALPICTRLHLWPLSSTTPSDDRAEVSGGSFCGLQGLEPGDVRPDGSINASCSMLLPKIRPQLVKLTMPASASSRAAGRLADRCLLTSSAGTATVRSCVSRIFQRRATTCRSRVNLYSNCLGRTSIRGVACRRCRPAARLAQPIGSGISHVCFRYVVRAGGSTLKGNGP
jgi:hypothetical protein